MIDSPLRNLYITAQNPVRGWYGFAPTLDCLLDRAGAGLRPLDLHVLETLKTHLDRFPQADLACQRSLEDLRRGALVVCAGQQPGLFGGPLLSLYKALTAVKLCQILHSQGVPAVPLFWNASEDHDLHEANRAVFPATEDNPEPRLFKLPLETTQQRSLSHTFFEAHQIQAARDFLLTEGCDENWLMRPDESWGSWMTRTMLALTQDTGLLVCEPSWFNSFASNLRGRILLEHHDIFSRVFERTGEMQREGIHPPVHLDTGVETGLFLDCGERRTKIKAVGEGRFSCGDEVLSQATLLNLIETRPDWFSHGVLTRPLFQQQLFPVLAQVVGPTELAYLAQVIPAFEFLDIPSPVFWPRQHILLLDKQSLESADFLRLDPPELLDLENALPQLAEPPFLDEFAGSLRTLLVSRPWGLAMDSQSKHEIWQQWKKLRKGIKQQRKKQLKRALGARHALMSFLRPRNRAQERVMTPCSLKISLDHSFATNLLRHFEPCSFEEKVLFLRERGIVDDKA